MNPPSDPVEAYHQAVALHNAGRLAEATTAYQRLLDQFPQNPLLLTGLGTIAMQRGDLEEGIRLLGQSLEIETGQPMAHCNLGLALRIRKRHHEALASFERAIAASPDFPDAYNYRGIVLQDLKRLEEALADFDRTIALQPGHYGAHNNRSIALQDLGRLEEALANCDRAIALKPELADAYCNRGNVLRLLNRLDEALAACQKATALNPAHALAQNNRGNVLQDLGRLEEALASYDRAIALDPHYAEAHYNHGAVLQEQRRLQEALASYDRAIALQPDYAEAHNNRGAVLHDLNRLDEALTSHDRAIALKPGHALAHNNRGVDLQSMHRLDEALASYQRAVAFDPEYADAHWNTSLVRLLAGQFEEGWKLYEWRWKREENKNVIRKYSQPLWLGEEPLKGKTLLVYAEQGLGDVIQACRYAPMAAALGAHVVLEVQPALVSLLSTLKGNFTIVETGKPLPPFDLHCPVMSLPLAFKTTLVNVPASVPYLHADADKLKIWQQRLNGGSRPKIGLAWSGSTIHKNDHNRSIPLRMLGPLLQLPAEFHSLQKEIRAQDMAALADFGQIHAHQEQLHDFSDTAALVQEMDLVISVDTSVAHLSGALGRPTWVLLPFAPDYRWMLERTDTPWYPTMTLFRQDGPGEWQRAIAAAEARLRERLQA